MENREKRVCMKCQQYAENGLPLCDACHEELRDFKELANWLNQFKGDKEDLYWIINSQISNRQSNIISQCKVVYDYGRGIITIQAIEPSDSTLKTKPWLWDKYLHIKQQIKEIELLRRALKIVREHYGVVECG